jgi:23S rRNA (uracil1939-C5)-methyltransferase
MLIREGDAIDVEIQALTADGEGQGRAAGVEVRVPGAFPGEKVRARLLHVGKHGVAHGRLLGVLRPDLGRREPPCPNHPGRGGKCTGCPLLPLDDDRQRALLREHLERAYGLVVEGVRHLPGGALGYRRSSKRIAFGSPGYLRLGSFARGTHRPADMAGCLLEDPGIERAFAELVAEANRMGVAPYDERDGRGDLRYVWAKSDGERVLLTLVTGNPRPHVPEALAAALKEPSAVAWSVQSGQGNTLRGESTKMLRGDPLSIELASVRVPAGPLGFLQPNPAMLAEAYHALVRAPGGAPHGGHLALDLYAGAGVTTALLRERFEEVIPCEAYPESAEALGVPAQKVEAFLEAILADEAHPHRAPELVVANPPRRGLGPEVVALLRRLAPRHLQIMACGPAGLARDLAALEEGGLYRRERLEAYASLPQTPHVELVASLVRQ